MQIIIIIIIMNTLMCRLILLVSFLSEWKQDMKVMNVRTSQHHITTLYEHSEGRKQCVCVCVCV